MMVRGLWNLVDEGEKARVRERNENEIENEDDGADSDNYIQGQGLW